MLQNPIIIEVVTNSPRKRSQSTFESRKVTHNHRIKILRQPQIVQIAQL